MIYRLFLLISKQISQNNIINEVRPIFILENLIYKYCLVMLYSLDHLTLQCHLVVIPTNLLLEEGQIGFLVGRY